MTTFIKQIPELSVEGFDGAARRAVRSLGDPGDWKKQVVKEIKKLQPQHSSVGEWLDTDPDVVDDVLQKPDDKVFARNWRMGFRTGLAILLESVPLAIQECQALAPLLEDGIFLSLGLLIQELEKVFVKIMALPRDRTVTPPSQRDRPRRDTELDEDGRTHKGLARTSSAHPNQPPQQRTNFARDITGRMDSLSTTEQSNRPSTGTASSRTPRVLPGAGMGQSGPSGPGQQSPSPPFPQHGGMSPSFDNRSPRSSGPLRQRSYAFAARPALPVTTEPGRPTAVIMTSRPPAGTSTQAGIMANRPPAQSQPGYPAGNMAQRPPAVPSLALYPPDNHTNLPILDLLALVSTEELDACVRQMYRRPGICALCGKDVTGGGHLTRDCTATALAYTLAPIIARRDHRKLYIQDDYEICLTHNVFKSCTGCFEPHQCSLCGGDHSAILCHLHRPDQVRKLVLDCFRVRLQEYTKRQIELQRQSRVLTGEPRIWKVSLGEVRRDDEEEDAVVGDPTPGLVPTGGDPTRLNWPSEQNFADEQGQADLVRLLESFGRDIPAPPDTSRVFAHHPNLLLPRGVVNHISGDSFVNATPPYVRSKVRSILQAAGSKPSLRQFKHQKDRDDQALLAQNRVVREMEKSIVARDPQRYKRDHFLQPGLKHPRQLADGSITLAGVHLLLNYPSLHDDKMVLTVQAFSTRLLRMFELSPPALRKSKWQGDLNLACWNRIPVKGDAATDKANLRLRQLDGEDDTKPYPPALIRAYDTHRAQWYLDAAQRGDSKVVLAFGSGQTTLFDKLAELNDDLETPLELVEWEWETKALVEDEYGGPSARTTMLREELSSLVQPVRAGDNQPFPNCTLAQTSYTIDTHNRPTVSVPCLLLHGPTGGILFIKAVHPEATQAAYAYKEKVQAFDYAVNFVARAVKNELFGPSLAPSFLGSRLDAARRLELRVNPRSRYPSGMQILQYQAMSDAAARVLLVDMEKLQKSVRLPQDGKRLIIFEHMYDGLHQFVRRTSVTPATEEGPMRYTGYAENLVLRAKLGIQSAAGTRSAQLPRTPAQTAASVASAGAAAIAGAAASRRAQLGSANSITRIPNPEEEYQAVCACGLITKHIQVERNSGVPVAVYLDISEGASHKPNVEKTSGACLVGFPTDDELRSSMLVKIKDGKLKPPTGLQRQTIAAAIQRYRNGTAPPPTTADDIAEFRRRKAAREARLREARSAEEAT